MLKTALYNPESSALKQKCVFLKFPLPNCLMSVKGAATRALSDSWSFLNRKCRSAGWYLGCLVNASFSVGFRAIT